MSNNVKELIKQVNQKLQQGEPGNISVDDHSGYTGYDPQSLIDTMNEVFDIGMWGFEEISNEVEARGDKAGLAIAHVRVWIKDIAFQPTAYGQSTVTRGDIGDAKKGAQTDALKKALSYFSIGNRAYLGLLQKNQARQQSHSPQQQPSGHKLADIKKLAMSRIGITDKSQWQIFVAETLGQFVPENQLTAEHLQKLYDAVNKQPVTA